MTSSELHGQRSGGAGQSVAGSRPTTSVSIRVSGPLMCRSTGVCGPVERYNLVQQPGASAANRQVQQALAAEGTDCLPLVLGNGVVGGSDP